MTDAAALTEAEGRWTEDWIKARGALPIRWWSDLCRTMVGEMTDALVFRVNGIEVADRGRGPRGLRGPAADQVLPPGSRRAAVRAMLAADVGRSSMRPDQTPVTGGAGSGSGPTEGARTARDRRVSRYAVSTYLGDWHTHPEDVPKPSPRDLASIDDIARRSMHQLPGFLLCIVGQLSGARLPVRDLAVFPRARRLESGSRLLSSYRSRGRGKVTTATRFLGSALALRQSLICRRRTSALGAGCQCPMLAQC